VDVDGRKIHVRDRGELANDAEIKTPAGCSSVDISEELINQILDYLVIIHTDEVETNHLFIKLRRSRSGQPLEYADVNDLFQRLKRRTGIDAHSHLLRHSSLTSLAKNGCRPEVLRERAGHAQFQYTYQLYVHPSEEEMREEWEKTAPLLQLKQHEGKEQVRCHHIHLLLPRRTNLIQSKLNSSRISGMSGSCQALDTQPPEAIICSISHLSPAISEWHQALLSAVDYSVFT
jgi:hypothetical protein